MKNQLTLVGVTCFIFMIVEFGGGYISNSSALMTDAAHQFSDVLAIVICIISLVMSERRANKITTYGYHRLEVFGALLCILVIWTLVGILCYEATIRIHACIYHKKTFFIDPKIMLITAIISLVFNMISLWQLGILTGDGKGIVEYLHGVFRPYANDLINKRPWSSKNQDGLGPRGINDSALNNPFLNDDSMIRNRDFEGGEEDIEKEKVAIGKQVA